MLLKKLLVPLDLQTFADDTAEESNVLDENRDQDVNTGVEREEKVKTFTQEEVDTIIKGRLAKERKSWEKQIQEQQTEAEKLATMTENEKKNYQEKKKETDLAQREAAITRRELMAQAKDTLADKGLPISLAEVLTFTDAETCNKSIDIVSKAFQDAVEKSVNDRLKGGTTPKKASAQEGQTLNDLIYKNMKGQ